MKINKEHLAITLVNGAWYGVREMKLGDLIAPDIRDVPDTDSLTVRFQFKGSMMAADRITQPITLEDASKLNLTKERLAEINEDVILQNFAATAII